MSNLEKILIDRKISCKRTKRSSSIEEMTIIRFLEYRINEDEQFYHADKNKKISIQDAWEEILSKFDKRKRVTKKVIKTRLMWISLALSMSSIKELKFTLLWAGVFKKVLFS